MPEGRGPRARASVYAGAAAVLAGSGSARSGLIGWRQALFAWLHRCAREEAEQRRLFLWLPVLFGAGVLLYFAADQEPLLWSGGVAAAVFGGAAFAMHRQGKPAAFALSLALAVLFAGFFAACLNTAMVTAPAVKRIMIARTIAFVESIDYRTNGARLVLAPHTIEGMAAADVPRRVRVTMRWRPVFAAGATLSATLRVLPP
ncbi:MAG: competence protein ComEC, partial [Beijerinckiaceae bacterium]|nr:competence protein ComEC [Beijerinckiaceae bacterium]